MTLTIAKRVFFEIASKHGVKRDDIVKELRSPNVNAVRVNASRALYKMGLDVESIASIIGCNASTVRKAMRNAPGDVKAKRAAATQALNAAIQEKYIKGMSKQLIAETLDCSKSMVYAALQGADPQQHSQYKTMAEPNPILKQEWETMARISTTTPCWRCGVRGTCSHRLEHFGNLWA